MRGALERKASHVDEPAAQVVEIRLDPLVYRVPIENAAAEVLVESADAAEQHFRDRGAIDLEGREAEFLHANIEARRRRVALHDVLGLWHQDRGAQPAA